MSVQVTLNISRSCLWAPFKELLATVDAAINRKELDVLPELETVLRIHKPNFISLLRNPVRSPLHKSAVQRASTEGISIEGQPTLQVLDQSLVDEALVISEMFDLNELTSLELLIAGQQQQPYFPGLTRGLVAVMLYYDGRQSLVNSLRALVQGREGRTWTLGLSKELVEMITRYTDQLKEDGLINKILEFLEGPSVTEELDVLQKNRAMGGPRYRKQVADMVEEIRQSLAEIILGWSCQGSFTGQEMKRLLQHLSKHASMKSDGSLDSVTLTLTLAVLYAMDVSLLQRIEEVDIRAKMLPVIADSDFARCLHQELTTGRGWENASFLSIFQFAWSISLRTLFQTSWALAQTDLNDCVEQDEKILDSAIEAGAFLAIQKLVVASATFHQEEFYVKRIHTLLTDFIVQMPLKVKELRNRGDESARIIIAHTQEGLQPPSSLHRHFEHLMNLITDLYTSDELQTDLAFEYWCPTESIDQNYLARPPLRQVSLYKFVRLAGDLLPAPLFVPYINMLCSLSRSYPCAHQCFTMLKMNGKGMGSQSSIISWDHFYESLHQYYGSLRQEVAVISDTQHLYRQHPHSRGITPQEVDGLNAVLGLMATVIENDEMAQVLLWENPQYVPGVVLIGLISCSVPPHLKARLLNVLSAFAKSPDISSVLWQQLEISQLIPTVKSLSVYKSAGIQMDLNEVESRMEEYPITRAALTLLSTLISHPLPMALGAGQRCPGFDPYLEYVRDTVLLPFYTRAYKSEGERWDVGSLCLQIMMNLLEKYKPCASDFTGHVLELPGGVTVPSGGPPGYTLMVQLLQDGPLLRVILQLLDEGVSHFDRHAPTAFRKKVEVCTLWCLKILHRVLICQGEFLSQIRATGSGLLVTSLDRLLLGVNPRSGQPDHIVIISKFIMFSSFLPKHARESLSTLQELCQTSQIAQHLVVAFTTSNTPFEELLHGFVEALDTDAIEVSPLEADLVSKDASPLSVIKQQILQLILVCLRHASPNLAHLLLGFQVRKPVPQTVLQDPGVLSSPRTCLHAVLAALDAGCTTYGYPVAIQQTPVFAELCYKLLYFLCSNRDTTSPTLRYLRTNHDFVYRHLQLLPFKQSSENLETLCHAQQSWLLKTLAIELRILSAYQQRSHVQRLLKLLLEDSPEPSRHQFDADSQDLVHRPSIASKITSLAGSVRRKLMRLLDCMVFTNEWTPFPTFEYLDSGKIDKIIAQCEGSNRLGPKHIDMDKLKQRLLEELPAVQGLTSLPQRPLLAKEINEVLQHVLQRNKALELVHSRYQVFDAWRQVTEVLFTACSLEILSTEEKHQIILEICQELLNKVLEEGILAELTAPVSGVVLLLMATLHHSLLPESPSNDTQSLLTLSSSLAVVLRGILECLMKTGLGVQRVRVNYYGALLNLLMIVQKPKQARTSKSSGIESAVLQQISDSDKICKEHMETISSFGESLMDVVCRDACSGHEVTKMSALAGLDTIVALDSAQHWLNFLDLRGYLRHIISSLVQDDQQLQLILTRGSNSMRVLYVFESKLSLLTRIAESRMGALALLRAGLFQKLAECASLHLRPEKDYGAESSADGNCDDQFNLPVAIRCFQQIITPAFQTVQAVLTTLGNHHYEAFSQLMHFIAAHAEVFSLILRDRSNLSNLNATDELSLVSAVLSRLSLDHPTDNMDPVLIEQQGKLSLLHNRLVALLPHATSELLAISKGNATQNDLRMKVRLLQIVANILSCCRSLVSSEKNNQVMTRILFTPNLVDISSREKYFLNKSTRTLYSESYPPNLGLLVTLLANSCEQINAALASGKKLEHSLDSIGTMSAVELKEWLSAENRLEGTSNQHLREVAKLQMIQTLRAKLEEVSLHAFIIENCLLVLWRHLEYFLRYCVPTDDAVQTTARLVSKGAVTKSDLEALRADVRSVFTDPLFNKVHAVQQFLSKEHSHVDFAGVILRRLKRIVQIEVK